MEPSWSVLFRSDLRMVGNLLGMDNAGRVNRTRGAFAAVVSLGLTIAAGWLTVHYLLRLSVSYFGPGAFDILLAVAGTLYFLAGAAAPGSTRQTLFPPYTVALFAMQPVPARDVVIWRTFTFLSVTGIIQVGLAIPVVIEAGVLHGLSPAGYFYLGGNIFLLIALSFLVKIWLASLYPGSGGRYRFAWRLFWILLTAGAFARIAVLLARPGEMVWQPGEIPVLALLAWQQGNMVQIVAAPAVLLVLLAAAASFTVRASQKPTVYLEEVICAAGEQARARFGRLQWPRPAARWCIISRLETVGVLRNPRVLGAIFILPAVTALIMGTVYRFEPTGMNFLAAILATSWAVFSSAVKQLVVINRDFELFLLGYPLQRRDVILGRALAATLLGLPAILVLGGLITLAAPFSLHPPAAVLAFAVTSFFTALVTIALTLAFSYRFFRWFAGNTFSDALVGQAAGICSLLLIVVPGLLLGRLILTSSGVWPAIGATCGVTLALGGAAALLKTSEIFARRYLA